jgi:hypothetical protein
MYFSKGFYVYFPPDVHVYIRVYDPHINTSVIHNRMDLARWIIHNRMDLARWIIPPFYSFLHLNETTCNSPVRLRKKKMDYSLLFEKDSRVLIFCLAAEAANLGIPELLVAISAGSKRGGAHFGEPPALILLARLSARVALGNFLLS